MPSSVDRTCQALERIRRFNGGEKGLGAITWLNPGAMDAAEQCDRELREKGPRTALHGMTFVIKDNIDLAGVPTTAGSAALINSVPATSADAVVRVQQAGAILIGKANMSELALSHGRLGYSSTAGWTRNPYDLSRDASGSSSGPAVAVAAKFADFALGTDTAGSIRGPASVTGVAGFRPTHGLASLNGIVPLSPSLDVVGPLARDAGTAGMVLSYMIADAALAERLREAARAEPGIACEAAKIGFVMPIPAGHPDVARTAGAATEAMVSSGMEVLHVDLPQAHQSLWPLLDRIINGEFAPALNRYLKSVRGGPADIEALIAHSEQDGRINPGRLASLREAAKARVDLATADRERAAVRSHVASTFEEHSFDAIAFPTIACPASPLPGVVDERYTCSSEDPYTTAYIAGATGFPEITVPVGATQDGLPIGLSLLGRPYAEPILVRLGRTLERLIEGPAPPSL